MLFSLHASARRWGHEARRAALIIFCVLCILPILTLMSAPAFAAPAYSLNGRWPNQPNSGCCAHFYPTQGSSFPDDVTNWNNGLAAWTHSSANVIAYVPASNPDPRMQIYDFNCSACDPGVTTITIDQFGNISHSDSAINHYFTGGFGALYGQMVAAHEFGHAMGLGHNPNNQCVLMYPSDNNYWNCGVIGPHSDDINGINALY
jgi:matrixin